MNVKYGSVPVIVVDVKTLKDWVWDFRAKDNNTGHQNFMSDGDTVVSLTLAVPTGVVVETGPTLISTDTAVQYWFSFLTATAGTQYKVEASLVTADGRKDEFPIIFEVTDY